MNSLFVLILGLSVLFTACSQDFNEGDKLPDRRTIEETLIGTNRMLLETDDQDIDDFINRHGWDMKRTGSGLRYEIYKNGAGEDVTPGSIAIIHYSVSLLSGHKVYSSFDDDAKEFRVGRGGVESGLEQGILLMSVGDKARFILPPHLAHGFPGDGDKIPKRATIVYDVELIGLK